MKRSELIAALAKATGTDKKTAQSFLDALGEIIIQTLNEGGEVPLPGLGKFRTVRRKARRGRHPATGAQIDIPAKTVVKFFAAKQLRGTHGGGGGVDD